MSDTGCPFACQRLEPRVVRVPLRPRSVRVSFSFSLACADTAALRFFNPTSLGRACRYGRVVRLLSRLTRNRISG